MFRNLKNILLWPEHMAVSMCRSACKLHKGGRVESILAQIFYRLNLMINGCDIIPLAEIGNGLKLPHPIGVVIGGATIGDNVTIYQNVTIGSIDSNGGMMPIVEDKVTLYSGAVVVGPIRIGKNAVIGANSFVTCDVPANSLAVGCPARIISDYVKN